jgi:hypothetical protein
MEKKKRKKKKKERVQVGPNASTTQPNQAITVGLVALLVGATRLENMHTDIGGATHQRSPSCHRNNSCRVRRGWRDWDPGNAGRAPNLVDYLHDPPPPPRLPPSSSTTIPDPRTGSHYCTSRFAAGWGEGRPYAGVVSRVACPGDWLCCVGRFPLLSSG